jgi:hypothetical protein
LGFGGGIMQFFDIGFFTLQENIFKKDNKTVRFFYLAW